MLVTKDLWAKTSSDNHDVHLETLVMSRSITTVSDLQGISIWHQHEAVSTHDLVQSGDRVKWLTINQGFVYTRLLIF
jgi:hypothetical protein